MIIDFSIKPSSDPTSDTPRPWFGSPPEFGSHWFRPIRRCIIDIFL